MEQRRILVLGAGHGGAAVVGALRQAGFGGTITLVGDEEAPPYNRPPLSKACLKGDVDMDGLLLKPRRFYEEQGIELLMGERALSVDRLRQVVTFLSGREIPYDHLVLALGARPRPLPLTGGAAGLSNVLSLRNLADAVVLKAALQPGSTLGIIGGGYIGLEVAASARALGCNVVLFEREGRLLSRTASGELSTFFHATHTGHGVQIELEAAVEEITSENGVATGIRLTSGATFSCDTILVGAGALPNEELAADAGLACDGGVLVDHTARTSDPAIFAIGDMTRRPLPLYGDRRFRLESVPSAMEQARQVAASICGGPAPAPETPWFWSDQYDLKLQIAGLAFATDQTILRGDPANRKFSVIQLLDGFIQAIEAVNAPADFMAGRMMIAHGQRVDPAKMADATIPLKQCGA